MSNDLSKPFFKCRGLPSFGPILKSWVKVCQKYKSKVAGDRVIYYGERAHIGFLAAAIWSSGGVALEEWSTNKRSPDGKGRHGRSDLWLQRANLKLYIEAKHAWIALGGKRDKSVESVRAKLAEAQEAAGEVAFGREKRSVGMLFAVPFVQRADARDAECRLKQWLADLKKLDYLAMAATFDTDVLKRRGSGVLYPGVALLIGKATSKSRSEPSRLAA